MLKMLLWIKNVSPLWTIRQLMRESKENQQQKEALKLVWRSSQICRNGKSINTCSKVKTSDKNVNKTLKKVLSNNKNAHITYTGKKLSSRFHMKDKTNKKHKDYLNC